MKQTKLCLILLTILAVSFLGQVVYGDVDTDTSFALSFGTGESFRVEDDYRLTSYTFTVESGSLSGTGTLNVNSGVGTLVISSTGVCALSVSGYSSSSTVYVDGAIYVRGSLVNLVAGQTVTITWKSITTIIVGDGEIVNLYFRSDTYTTLGVSAYGLDEDYTNIDTTTSSTAAGATDFYYGFRVWLFESATESTELTAGTPIGIIALDSNTTGYESATWTFEGANVVFGYEALKVIVYERQNSSDWTAKATFVSDVLLTNYLQPSTWTFELYVTYTVGTSTASSFSFGSSSYKSGIYNFIYTMPLHSQLQWWRLSHGDLIGFLIGGYVDIIGEAFYVFILLGVAASLYRRFGHLGPIAFFFTIFGGVGGIVWLFVPLWAAIIVATFVILITTFIVWRIIR
jgi:hypothetical protein